MEEKVTEKETRIEQEPLRDRKEEHRVTAPDTVVKETEVERTVDTDSDSD